MAGSLILPLAACLYENEPLVEPWGSLPPAIAIYPEKLRELERQSGGTLGVYIVETGSGRQLGHRADELAGMCSTFKLALAAAVFKAAEKGELKLDEFVPYGEADMENYAPVTRENLSKGGMTIDALSKATQVTSDNTAANLLIAKLGGPAAVTRFLRDIGDDVTRLDRDEPTMNWVPEGEMRDTTSPRAMALTMQKILFGDVLTAAHRQALIQRMEDTKTGSRRIRAGLPESWRSGDRTGTAFTESMHNKTNDIAIFWPPARPPVIVTAYYEADGYYDGIRPQDEDVLAEVGRIAAALAVEWHGGLD